MLTKSLLIGLLVSLAAGKPTRAAELPLELAFDLRSPAQVDRGAVHPAGLWVAFGIDSPAARTARVAHERYLPGGTPANLDGVRLHLAAIPEGELTPIGPERANSWRPAWSAAGDRLAFYCDAAGKPELWMYDVASKSSRRVADVTVRASLFPGDSPLWSPDGETIYVRTLASRGAPSEPAPREQARVYASGRERTRLKETESGGTNDFLRQESRAALVAVTLGTGQVRTVVSAEAAPEPEREPEREPSAMRLSPSGRWISYVSVPRRVSPTAFEYVFDLTLAAASGGETHLIAKDLPVPDNPFVGNYQWHPTRDLLVFVEDRKLWLLEPGQAPRRIGTSLERVSPSPLAYTRNGASVAVRGRTDSAANRDVLALVPLDGTDARVIPLPESPLAEVVTVDRKILWQPSPEAVAFTSPGPDGEDRQATLCDLRSGARAVVNRSPGGLSLIGGNRDQTVFIGIDQRFDQPADLSLLGPDLAPRRLTRIEPRLEGVSVGSVASFKTKVTLFDGERREVSTTVLLPEGRRADERLPTLVSVYGGAEAHTVRWQYAGGSVATLPAQIFTSRGYAVLFPEIPITPPGRAGHPAREITDVLLPQVERAIELGFADENRLTLIGQSYGAYSAAAVACESNRFQAAIAINGVYDLLAHYGRMDAHNSDFAFAWSESGQGRMGTHPWGDRERYVANSPYHQIDRLQTPLLLLVGTEDEDAEEGRKLFRAAKRLERTVQLAVYPGCGHAIQDWPIHHAVDAAQRILDFLSPSHHQGVRPGPGRRGGDGLR